MPMFGTPLENLYLNTIEEIKKMEDTEFIQHCKIMSDYPIFKFAIRKDLEDTGDKFLPYRATPKASGWDVKAAPIDRKPIVINAGEYSYIPLGFRAFIPEGWWFELKPRSSSFAKKYLHPLYGTIDEDYEGQAIFVCRYLPTMLINPHSLEPSVKYQTFGPFYISDDQYQLKIDFGEAIGQIIPVKRQEMVSQNISNEEFETLCANRNDKRGVGGFGSTGK